MMSRASFITRCFRDCTRCNHYQAKSYPLTCQYRHKSQDVNSTDIVVEKEKKKRKWRLGTLNWEELPKKFAQLSAHFEEMKRRPEKQRLRGRAFRDDEILYCFREKEDLDHWEVVTDEVFGGKSWGEFIQSDNEMTATFRGYISQKLPKYMLRSTYDQLEEKPFYRGFAKLETKPFLDAFGQYDQFDLTGCNVFEMRLRGEGRKYLFEMWVDYGINNYVYMAPIHTRGGPLWETVKIPYSKLICTKRNTITYDQDTFHPSKINCFRFLLLDANEGPFQLELDYIAIKKDYTENQDESDYWDPHQHTNAIIGTW